MRFIIELDPLEDRELLDLILDAVKRLKAEAHVELVTQADAQLVAKPEPEPKVKPKRKRRGPTKKRTQKVKPSGRKVVDEPVDRTEAENIEAERAQLDDPDALLKEPDKVVPLREVEPEPEPEPNANAVFSALVQRSQKAAIGLLKKHGQSRFSTAEGAVLQAMLSDAKQLLQTLGPTAQ